MRSDAPMLSDSLMNSLRKQHIQVLQLSAEEIMKTPALPKTSAELYIASPENYLVLKYDVTTQPDAVFQDIKKLISVTKKKSS